MEATRSCYFLLALIGTLGTAYSCSTCPRAEDDSYGYLIDSSSSTNVGPFVGFFGSVVNVEDLPSPTRAAGLFDMSPLVGDGQVPAFGLLVWEDADIESLPLPGALGWSVGGAITKTSSGEVQMIMADDDPTIQQGVPIDVKPPEGAPVPITEFCTNQRVVLTIKAATADNPDGAVYIVPPVDDSDGCEFLVSLYSDGCGVQTACSITKSVECNTQTSSSSFCQNLLKQAAGRDDATRHCKKVNVKIVDSRVVSKSFAECN